MSTASLTQVYRNISRVCRISQVLLYILGTSLFIGALAITGVSLVGKGDIDFGKNSVDLATLSLHARLGLASLMIIMLSFAIRVIWLMIKLTNCFKQGEIFSETTAKLSSHIALSLLIAIAFGWGSSFTTGVLSGRVSLGLSNQIFTIIFAYLFSWVINIGSQLKAENDMTI